MRADALVLLQQATVSAGVEYDSNPVLVASNRQSVLLYTTVPKYTISAVDDRNRWFATGGLSIQRSSNSSVSGSRQDPAVTAGWEYQFEKSNFNVIAYYNKASSRLNEFTTSGIVDQDGTVTSKSISASWDRQLSDRIGYSLSGQYIKTDYTGSAFTNYATKSISSSLTYELNEKIKPFIQVGISQLNSEGNSTRSSTSKSYSLGTAIDINPTLKMSASAGINQQQLTGNGWVASTSLFYTQERYNLEAALSRNVTPSGLGDFQETDNASLKYSYELSEKSNAGADFVWSSNSAINGNETRQLSGWYLKELSNYWQFKLSLIRKDFKNNSQSANANIFGFSLIYNTLEF